MKEGEAGNKKLWPGKKSVILENIYILSLIKNIIDNRLFLEESESVIY